MSEMAGSGLPGAKEEIYRLFDELGIDYEVIDHPPLYKEGDDETYRVNIDAIILKNLFLRDKDKGNFYMYSLPLKKRADLKALQKYLKASRISFGNEDMLFEKMHIKAGSVSVMNFAAARGTDVKLVIDSEIKESPQIAVHPNDNTATVVITIEDLEKVLDSLGVDYEYATLPEKQDKPQV
jgi:Ala-tRNA(Pro) deacylase